MSYRPSVTGFCTSWSGLPGVYLSGSLSLTSCFTLLAASLYFLSAEDNGGWPDVKTQLTGWLVENRWDVSFVHHVLAAVHWLDQGHQIILLVLVSSALLHLTSSLLLVLGTFKHRANLLIPWLISDLIILSFLTLIFISWTFIAFFVDILIAIVFPVLGGLLLGLWIVLWRNVWRFYQLLNQPDKLLD